MNPLGKLPPSTSPAFKLNKVDGKKILREIALTGASLALAYGVPAASGLHPTVNGFDLTPLVAAGTRVAADLLRRYIADNADQAAPTAAADQQ